MRKTAIVFILMVCLFLQPSTEILAAPPRPIKILWFANLHEKPHPENNPFWNYTKSFISAASKDLGIDLTIIYTKVNHFGLLRMADDILKKPETRPDAILFHNYKYTGQKLLELAEEYGVNSFVFNAGFSDNEAVGKPRTKYRGWIGELYPDDEYAGRLLAKELTKEAIKLEKRNSQQTLSALSFAGSTHSQASLLRVKGNNRFQKTTPIYNITNTIFTNWSKEKSKTITSMAIERNPAISIIWAASDLMAEGAVEGAVNHGWTPGKDFVAGGVDCLPIAQELIKNGKMAVSVGGHYTDGAWALILIHDYFNGIDFARTTGVTLYSKMFALTATNCSSFGDLKQRLTPESIDGIDFSSFSKKYNKSMKTYPLNAISFFNSQHCEQ